MNQQIRMLGVAAEIFEDALVPFLNKVLNNFSKKIKEEGTNRLHTAIAEAMGQMVWHIVDKLPSRKEQKDLLDL